MTPDAPTPPADETPAETVLVGDELATVATELLDSAEKFTQAGVKVPFSAARLLIEKARLAADALEKQLRKATGN